MSAQPSAAAFNANIFDNSTAYHNRLSRFRQYTAVAAVIGAHGWFAEGGAQVLREREIGVPDPAAPDTEYAYLIITGRARPNKCFVGPTGSYNPKFGDPLSKAKYGFVLECPDDDVVLKAAWNSSMDHLKIIEKDVCPGNSLYFFDDTNGVKGVRFTKPVFEKKSDVPPLTDTARWPVGSQNLERLKETAVTHDVQPFPLYNEQGHLVPPTEVERALPGCLVQVTFTLTYHSFPREGRIVESLSGKVVQALVLRKGRAKPPTPYNGRGIYMPAPSLELPGASTPNPPVLSQSPSTPVRFATHLQPETSPYGAHPFVFAHPAGGQGFAPAAAELHTVPAVRHAQPPNPPATPPPFGAHLTPETSPYGSHPFVFAHTVSPGIHPPLFGVSHPSNRPLGSVSSPASLPTTPLRNGTHPPLFGPNFHHSPTSTPPRPITPRHMGTHPPLFPYTPPTPTPIGTRVTHPLLTPAPPQVAQGGTHPPLFGPPLRYDAPRRPSTPLFLPGTPSPVENRNAQSNSASRVASSRPEERSPFIAAFVERPLHGSNAAAASWESPDGYHGAAERSPGFVPAGVSPFGQGGNIGSIPHIVRPTTPAQPPGISAFAHSGVLRAATNSPGYFPQSPSVARGAIHPAAGTFLPLEASPFPATFGGPAHAMGLYPETPGRTRNTAPPLLVSEPAHSSPGPSVPLVDGGSAAPATLTMTPADAMRGSPHPAFRPTFDEPAMTSTGPPQAYLPPAQTVMWGDFHEAAAQMPLSPSGLRYDHPQASEFDDFIVDDMDDTPETEGEGDDTADANDESTLDFYRRVREAAKGKRKVTFDDDATTSRKARRLAPQSSDDESDDTHTRSLAFTGGRGKR